MLGTSNHSTRARVRFPPRKHGCDLRYSARRWLHYLALDTEDEYVALLATTNTR